MFHKNINFKNEFLVITYKKEFGWFGLSVPNRPEMRKKISIFLFKGQYKHFYFANTANTGEEGIYL